MLVYIIITYGTFNHYVVCADGLISPDLLKVELSLISNANCKYSYPQSANPRINFGILEDSMICAGDIVDGGDTCTVSKL